MLGSPSVFTYYIPQGEKTLRVTGLRVLGDAGVRSEATPPGRAIERHNCKQQLHNHVVSKYRNPRQFELKCCPIWRGWRGSLTLQLGLGPCVSVGSGLPLSAHTNATSG